MRAREERGQTSTEYLGVVALVAAIVVVLALSGPAIGGTIGSGIESLVCKVAGTSCDDGSGDLNPGELAAREAELGPFTSAEGGRVAELLAEARQAREAGDLERADQILDQLELYEDLTAGGRGDLVSDLVSPTEGEFDDLVDEGTIGMGDTNRRYFRVEPSPGDGVVVMDFFIRQGESLFLQGDDRDVQDPLLSDLELTDSRITIVIDRESGRGVITQSETCTVSVFGADVCQAPRPIELGDIDTEPQLLPSSPNEFDIDADGDSITIDYDALNSITPGAVSVDGGVTLELGDDGFYEVTDDSRDDYPAIVTYQYKPGEDPREINYEEGRSVIGAIPGIPTCDLPKLPFGGPDLPVVPGPCF